LAAVRTGIKDAPRDDLALAVFDEGTVIAGVYTQSAFAAPPVDLAKERVTPRAWIVNSGNANAATGQPGRADAIAVCEVVAQELGLQGDDIQPFSTGVIGERLDVPRIKAAVPALVQGLSSDHWLAYGRAIMTTDTVTKAVSKRVRVDGSDIIVTGVAKGSGMIKPNMATMLAYIASNATVVPEVLDRMVQEVANESFNRITVDGDTSTNDCFMLAATGKSEMAAINSVADERYPRLKQVVLEVAQTLAQAIVRDGEGATKFVTVTVAGGEHPQECLEVAYTVAESPLVKTALFAGDANWGRFCMAIGRAEVAELDPSRVSLWLDEVQVASGGLMSDDYTEDAGASVLAQDEFRVLIDLGRGDASQTVWTTDLSYEYVRINAEYRS
jgi:glutamate N-acetyltransferase/amino-acid N-acetyltransferase